MAGYKEDDVRVFIRASGTEDCVKIHVESTQLDLLNQITEDLCKINKCNLNNIHERNQSEQCSKLQVSFPNASLEWSINIFQRHKFQNN